MWMETFNKPSQSVDNTRVGEQGITSLSVGTDHETVEQRPSCQTLNGRRVTLVIATEGSGLIHEIRPNKEETTIAPSTKNCKPTRVKAAQFYLQRTRYRSQGDHPERTQFGQTRRGNARQACDRAGHEVDEQNSRQIFASRGRRQNMFSRKLKNTPRCVL